MKVIIVDDEPISLNELSHFISQYKEFEIIAALNNPLQGLEEILRTAPDVVFLDIDMPEINGIEIAEELLKQSNSTEIVFVTAYNEFAIKAFELNAVDYLLKPVLADRFDKTFERLRYKKNLLSRIKLDNVKNILDDAGNRKLNSRIPLKKGERIFLCDPEDIVCIFAEGKITKVVTTEGNYESRDCLNTWEITYKDKKLFRCHKAYIVNLEKICEIIPWFNNTYNLKMKGVKEEVHVSRKYAKEFREILGL